jgi:hypothetical protein
MSNDSSIIAIESLELERVMGGVIPNDGGGGSSGSPPPKGKGKGLTIGQRIGITGVGLIGLLGGNNDVIPRPGEIPGIKPPHTTSQPLFSVI